MIFLLDTNFCIRVIRGAESETRKLASLSPGDVAVSIVTCYELYVGVAKCARPEEERPKVQKFLSTVKRLTVNFSSAIAAANIRADLERRGEMIGPYDILLAGQAQALGLTLVTANTNEFTRIPGLKIENWEKKSPK